MKTLLSTLIAVLLTANSALAEIHYQWLGIAGFSLTDGTTTLLFDPEFTRPKWWQVIFNRKVEPDQADVKKRLTDLKITKADGIFLSHTHFDHALDLPVVMNSIPSTLYGTPSARMLAESAGIPKERIVSAKFGGTYEIGKFKVTIFDTPHAEIFHLFQFAPGPIDEPLTFPANCWDYKVGESSAFLIEHPEGKIFFQQTSEIQKVDSAAGVKADVLFLTIANRYSTKDLVEKRIKPMESKRVIPLHFDDFMAPMNEANPKLLIGVGYDEFFESAKKLIPDVTLDHPKYGESVKIF